MKIKLAEATVAVIATVIFGLLGGSASATSDPERLTIDTQGPELTLTYGVSGDNVVRKKSTTLTVLVIVNPSNDPGRFNLLIDGIIKASSVSNNGTTGPIPMTVGTHNVTQTAGGRTKLALYTSVVGGDCSPSGVVTLAAGQNKTCTITNTRKPLTEAPLEGSPAQLLVAHGSWTQGGAGWNGYPTQFTFKLCPTGTTDALCKIYRAPGQSVTITIETWGGGGGGGSGEAANGCCGGAGGGGGGGGGYATTTVTAVVPSTFIVQVGRGGFGGGFGGILSNGTYGEMTAVSLNNTSSGSLVLMATGGVAGQHAGPDQEGGTPVPGGAGGTGTINSWPGARGYDGGYGQTCNGHAGGLGGAGGGPGRTGPGYINDGGDGGHGGYRNKVGCRAKSENNGLSHGKRGGHGKVTFTW